VAAAVADEARDAGMGVAGDQVGFAATEVLQGHWPRGPWEVIPVLPEEVPNTPRSPGSPGAYGSGAGAPLRYWAKTARPARLSPSPHLLIGDWPAMSVVIRAVLSMTVAIAALAAAATVADTLADVLGGIVALAAILVFTRTIMGLAAAPGEKPRRPDGSR
jgi:hypothetical protein